MHEIEYRFTRGCYARRKVTTNLRFSRFWTAGGRTLHKKNSQIGSLFKNTRGGIRTPDLLVRSQTLYPTGLQAQNLKQS